MATDSRHGIRLGDAARAMRALLHNPEDTAQVFRIIEALSGKNGIRTLAKFRRTSTGTALLRDRPELLDTLLDRESLSRLPAGSLGREYLNFLDSEGITAEGLKQASVEGRTRDPKDLPPELEFLRNRMRDTHDLWHVVTGYKGDLIGEASLLAFSFAQTKNPGVGFIVAIALIRGREPWVRRMILQGLVRGLRAAWLPVADWEHLLALPLYEVRHLLRVGPAPVYQTFRAPSYMRAAVA